MGLWVDLSPQVAPGRGPSTRAFCSVESAVLLRASRAGRASETSPRTGPPSLERLTSVRLCLHPTLSLPFTHGGTPRPMPYLAHCERCWSNVGCRRLSDTLTPCSSRKYSALGWLHRPAVTHLHCSGASTCVPQWSHWSSSHPPCTSAFPHPH